MQANEACSWNSCGSRKFPVFSPFTYLTPMRTIWRACWLFSGQEPCLLAVFMLTATPQSAQRHGTILLYELDRVHNAGRLEFRTELVAGHHESLQHGVSIEVHAPSRYLAAKGPGSSDKSGNRIRTNSISAVLSVSVSGKKMALLPGDIDSVGLADLFRSPQQLSAPILVYPHHGSASGFGAPQKEIEAQLIAAVKPRLVVFSIGRGRHSTPNPETVRLGVCATGILDLDAFRMGRCLLVG